MKLFEKAMEIERGDKNGFYVRGQKDLDDKKLRNVIVNVHCPSDYGFARTRIACNPPKECKKCWEREYK